jgi:hypothetical protein
MCCLVNFNVSSLVAAADGRLGRPPRAQCSAPLRDPTPVEDVVVEVVRSRAEDG